MRLSYESRYATFACHVPRGVLASLLATFHVAVKSGKGKSNLIKVDPR